MNSTEIPNELAAPSTEPVATPKPRARGKLAAAAALTIGLLTGGGFALSHTGGTAATASASSAQQPASGPGGVVGEVRVSGTIRALTASSMTVQPTSGSAVTYTVNSTTSILNNGATATLASLTVGEKVVVHVLPTASGATGTTAERVLAGTSATDMGPGGTPPSGSPPSGAPQAATGTGIAT